MTQHVETEDAQQPLPEYWRQVIEDAWARCNALQQERDRLREELIRIRPAADAVWNELIDMLIARASLVGRVSGPDGPAYEHDRSDQLWPNISAWLEWQRHSGASGVLADVIAQRNAERRRDDAE